MSNIDMCSSIIDCHNHILPDIDDGSVSTEMSTDMAKVAVCGGTIAIVVTPHHGNGVFMNSTDDILKLVDEYQHLFEQQSIPLKLHPGSELHLTPELVDEVISGQVLTYANQGCAVLIELPTHSVPIGVERVFEQLLGHQVTPIIAHPERNNELLNNPSILEKLVDMGCKSQLTGMSVDGRFGNRIKAVCHRWIDRSYAHIIASDAHRPQGRSPDLSSCYNYVEQQYSNEVARLLLHDNPMRLTKGEALQKISPMMRLTQTNTKPASFSVRERIRKIFRF